MKRAWPFLTILVAVLLSGVVHGLWTNRWGEAQAIKAATAKLVKVPMIVGDWEGHARELSAQELAAAEVDGYLLRRYVNHRTGSVVSLLIVCGRPGPVSVHLPEVCYSGGGYQQVGTTTRYSSPSDPSAEFKVVVLRKQSVTAPDTLRVLYAWGAGGNWTAPERPRVAFAWNAALYKMYVIRELVKADEAITDDPATDFIQAILPEVQQALFQGS